MQQVFLLFSDFFMFYQAFFALQVERLAIISYKHGICEWRHELQNELSLTM